MAELTLTDEERESASYLDWDDESLGKLLRRGLAMCRSVQEERNAVLGHSAALYLIAHCVEAGAAYGKWDEQGVTQSGKPIGSWLVTVMRHEEMEARLKTAAEKLSVYVHNRVVTDGGDFDEDDAAEIIRKAMAGE